jgi:AhpD family alkylhydroperoxidase
MISAATIFPAERGGVPLRTLGLVHLRVSQINGCSVCVDLALRFKKAEDTHEWLFAVAAWRDAPYFSDAERAALACRTKSGTKPRVTINESELAGLIL